MSHRGYTDPDPRKRDARVGNWITELMLVTAVLLILMWLLWQ